jgi:hypothetical protein
MSLPSLVNFKAEGKSSAEIETAILAAIKTDLPLAYDWFSKKQRNVHLSEAPASPLGKQITRICAATGLRQIVEKHLLNGNKIAFANCCDIMIMSPAKFANFNHINFQIETQNGVLNHADC